MKKFIRPIRPTTAIIMSVVTIMLMIPYGVISVSAITQSEFDNRLSNLRNQHPNYSTWYDSFDGGTQCFGFARLVAYNVFGSHVRDWEVSYSIDGVKAGDVLQYGNTNGSGHTVFVTSVSGETITFVDCNGNGNYSGGTKVRSCGIKWDNTINKWGNMYGRICFSYRHVSPEIETNERHWYDDLSPVDFGTDFYAKITTSNNHRDVCNSEGNVNLYESCDESNHVWYFIRQGDGSYKIKNAYGDNNYMDVYESLDENTNVQVWYDNTSDGQYWFIYTKDGSNYFLRPRCSDRVLDVYGGDNNIGDNIGIWTFNESPAQKYKISKIPFPYTTIGSDFYAKIITSRNGLELTATNGNVDIRNKSDSPNHVWRFILQSDNSYKILNMGDNVLDADGNVNDNVNVQMWSDNGMDSQRWYIYNNGNGYYYLKPKCADRVMDVTQALFDDGTNVGIFSYNGQDNQRFVIQKTLYPYEDIGTDFYAKIATVKNDMDVIANGGNVEIAEKSNDRNHIWFFHRKADGSYKLKNLQDTDNYMDVYNSDDDNVNVDIWCNNEGINQDWYFYKSQDGNYLIKTKASCRFLDVTGGENNAGDNVGIWTLTQSGAQIFKIESLKIGDINLDGTISISDVTAIQRHLAELEVLPGGQLVLVDTNGDGEIDISDATHLQMYLAEYGVVLGKQ